MTQRVDSGNQRLPAEAIDTWSVAEPFGRVWPDEAVGRELPVTLTDGGSLEVVDDAGERVPAQLAAGGQRIRYPARLAAGSTQRYRLCRSAGDPPASPLSLQGDADRGWRAQGAAVGISWDARGGLEALRGVDGDWRPAQLEWRGVDVAEASAEVLASGPVTARVRQHVRSADGTAMHVTWEVDGVTPVVWLSIEQESEAQGALVVRLGRTLQPPTHAYWRPHSPSAWRGPRGTVHCRQVYTIPDTGDAVHIGPFYNWAADAASFWACWSDAASDLLYLGWVRPSRTHVPDGVERAVVRVDPPTARLDLEVPLQRGRRCLALALLDRGCTDVGVDGAPNDLDGLHARLNGVGLGDLHAMHLEDAAPTNAFPRLWLAPDEVPEVRRRFQAWDWLRERCREHADDHIADSVAVRDESTTRYLGRDDAGAYLVTGDEDRARRALRQLREELDAIVARLLDYGPTVDDTLGIGLSRDLRALVLNLDLVLGSGAATADVRRDVLRKLAFVTEVQSTDDAWPGTGCGIARGNDNFHPDVISARGIAAALLDGHPRQATWLRAAVDEMGRYLESYHLPSGMSRESATYQLVSLAYALQLHAAAARRGFTGIARLPALRRSFGFLAATQTPVDPRCGHRMLPTVGHVTVHHWCQSLQAYFAWAAKAAAADDADFAARMMAAWQRGGGFIVPLHDYYHDRIWSPALLLMDHELAVDGDDADLQASAAHDGFGAVLRARHGEGDDDTEGYVAFKMGPSTGHFDADEGSFTWYAFGQPLLADFGCQYNPNLDSHPWLHNRISFDHRADGPPRGGQLLAHHFGDGIDYLCGEVRVGSLYFHGEWPQRDAYFDGRHAGAPEEVAEQRWRRHLVYVHALETIVLLDELDGDLPTDWSLQVYADSVRTDGGTASFDGQFGVDLDVHLLRPRQPHLQVSAFSHQGFDEPRLPSPWWRDARWTAPPGTSMSSMAEQALTLRARASPGQPYVAVLAARRAGQAQATVSGRDWHLRVETAGGTCEVATVPPFDGWQVSVRGRAGGSQLAIEAPLPRFGP